jgi:hypothetical protein
VGKVAEVVVGVEGVAGVVMGVERAEVALAAEAPKRREKVRARKDILFELYWSGVVLLLVLRLLFVALVLAVG